MGASQINNLGPEPRIATCVTAGDERVVVVVEGEIDLATVEQFRRALLEARRSPRVVVDLSEVTFMDSAGVNALVAAYHGAPRGGELRVVGLRPNVRRLFEITGILALFTDEGGSRSPAALSDT